jgi:nonsense-mediated mRNA decay protein 3
MGQICCKCGKSETEEQIVEGFCLSCFADEFPLIESFPEKQFHLTSCKLCGDLMYHNKWLEVFDDPKEIVLEFFHEYLKKVKKVKGTEPIIIADFEVPDFQFASKHELTVIFEGTPNEEVPPYQEEKTIEMVVNIGVCERCAKFQRGYYESTVQVRSDRRNITEEEQKVISKIIQDKKTESLGGNRMAYISKTVDQARGGIDLYCGSEKFGKSLATLIAGNMAASIEYSTKLKSVKDGKPLYQTTYCVRLPYFEKGDVVEYQNEPYQIDGINNGRVMLFKLKTQENKTLSLKESHPDYLKVLKKKDQFGKFIIMSLQPPNVSIMNSVSFETIDIDSKFLLPGHSDGEEILMVELPDGFYEVKTLD